MSSSPSDGESNMAQMPARPRRLLIALAIVALVVLAFPAASLYYEYSGGETCTRCHEIWQPYTDWRTSTHRNVKCSACHGEVFTLDAGFHLNNIRRLYAHLRGQIPENIRLKNAQLFQAAERCKDCHQEEYANWKASRHSATYAEMFLDKTHNHQRLLIEDCLRCHGMQFEGSIRDLVTPINTTGPWKLKHPELAQQPAIPCLTCHQMHHEGLPLTKPPTKDAVPAARQEIFRPSLALFDRRELMSVPLGELPLPVMRQGRRVVKISPDARQALCYQCHAPVATFQVGSGDDRTAVGVHEGISCLACHQKHRQTTRQSCADCHPRMSNCGLDVEKMDTTFKDPKSKHNIHFVKCLDCHPKGVRRRQRPSETAALAGSGLWARPADPSH